MISHDRWPISTFPWDQSQSNIPRNLQVLFFCPIWIMLLLFRQWTNGQWEYSQKFIFSPIVQAMDSDSQYQETHFPYSPEAAAGEGSTSLLCDKPENRWKCLSCFWWWWKMYIVCISWWWLFWRWWWCRRMMVVVLVILVGIVNRGEGNTSCFVTSKRIGENYGVGDIFQWCY